MKLITEVLKKDDEIKRLTDEFDMVKHLKSHYGNERLDSLYEHIIKTAYSKYGIYLKK